MKHKDSFSKKATEQTQGSFRQLSMRWLAQGLIFSITLNIALLATFFYISLTKEKSSLGKQVIAQSKSAHFLQPLPQKISDCLEKHLTRTFDELKALLLDETPIEQGQRVCDLALACLVACHHFDLTRALGASWPQTRNYAFKRPVTGKWASVTLFSGLGRDEREAIRQFAVREMWPLTFEGLFLEIKKKEPSVPIDLLQAFYLTKQFYALYQLVQNTAISTKRTLERDLQTVLLRLDMQDLVSFTEDFFQATSRQERKKKLMQLLIPLFSKQCLQAGRVLFAIDPQMSVCVFTDDQLSLLMRTFDELTLDVERCLLDVEVGVRSDALRAQARSIRAQLDGASLQPPVFVNRPQKSPNVIPPVATKAYVVEFGDTLWKISQEVGIPVWQLKKMNALDSDVLIPGKVLLLPKHNN